MRKNEVKLKDIVKRNYINKFQDQLMWTNSTLFVLPMINIQVSRLGKYFLNCFISDSEYETLVERPLFLLFKFSNKTKQEEEEAKTIHKELLRKQEFITYYYTGEIENSDCIMYLFSIDKKYEKDYQMFLKGSYSKFSPEFKEKFPKYRQDATGKSVRTVMSQVVLKGNELRQYWEDRIGVNLPDDAEVWSSPNIEEIETI